MKQKIKRLTALVCAAAMMAALCLALRPVDTAYGVTLNEQLAETRAKKQEIQQQVKEEIRSGYYPRLLPVSCSLRSYQIVFAGSPNWCGTIAPPLASWLYRNNLSGKIILPFYSHCGGVSCDFGRDISRICPKADVREPLGVLDNEKKDMGDRFRDWLLRTGTECLIRSGK